MKSFILKMDRKVQSLNRHYDKNRMCCDRELFIAKVGMKYLKHKYFKMTINGKTDYVFFPVVGVKMDGKKIYDYCGIKYYLGWNDSEYELYFVTQNDFIEKKLHVNELSDIKLEEISKERFFEVYALFHENVKA